MKESNWLDKNFNEIVRLIMEEVPMSFIRRYTLKGSEDKIPLQEDVLN